MNIPRWLIMFLSENFTGTQVDIIAHNWYNFTSISLNNSTREQLLSEAKMVLTLSQPIL
jgi:hypothetical protein